MKTIVYAQINKYDADGYSILACKSDSVEWMVDEQEDCIILAEVDVEVPLEWLARYR